jgi:hypothetical protein
MGPPSICLDLDRGGEYLIKETPWRPQLSIQVETRPESIIESHNQSNLAPSDVDALCFVTIPFQTGNGQKQ